MDIEEKPAFSSNSDLYDFALSLANGTVCRLCLQYKSTMHAIEEVEDELVEDLQQFAGITIEGTDVLPNVICANCLKLLTQIADFKVICHKSEKRLRRLKKLVPELDFKRWNPNTDIDITVNKVMEVLKTNLPRSKIRRKSRKLAKIALKTKLSTIFKREPIDEIDKLNQDGAVNQSEDIFQSGSADFIDDNMFVESFASDWPEPRVKKKVPKMEHIKESRIPYQRVDLDTEEMKKLKETNPKEYKKQKEKCLCGLCGKMFASKGTLGNHYRSVHIPHKYICPECGRTFGTMQNMKEHQTIHSNVKRFACDMCGHRTRRRSCMAAHMKTHSPAYPYGCTLCPKVFKRVAERNRHQERHTMDKSYICNVCSKQFKQRRGWRSHMLAIHEGIKRFACEFCPAVYGFKEPLRQHRRVVHGETRTLLAIQREKEREETLREAVPLVQRDKSQMEESHFMGLTGLDKHDVYMPPC